MQETVAWILLAITFGLMALGVHWLWNDAKEHGTSPVLWTIFTVIVGVFPGLVAYFLYTRLLK